jgi:DNA-binding transcriptional ArsR family regulator
MRASNAAPIFAALGDETRLHLVARLGREGPLSIAKLTERTSITRQAVAKHLRVLEGAGVVHGSRDGRESVWTLETKRLEDARAHLEIISRQWDDTLERLRAFVEE